MATALIYGAPGSGKTINTTRIPGKTLLLSSDNSARVLNNFDRPNLTVKEAMTFKKEIVLKKYCLVKVKFKEYVVYLV